ncbi:MAG: glycosyl hydrolase 115 family protein [Bacteroidaceae bacterium]|nr:glycosyl hydrolase 115 family protein [Bacteroidaceae bacterium]
MNLRFIAAVALNVCVWLPNVAQSFHIKSGENITIFTPKAEAPVANTAFDMLREDVKAVLGSSVKVADNATDAQIVCKYDKSLPREGFKIFVEHGKLHIDAADAHGMAYGLLEVSRLMGVSPWEWWADCTIRSVKDFKLKEGFIKNESPAVAFRGIFINDEDWGLLPWANKREPESWTIKQGRLKGAVGPKTTEKIFQLLLRLRANYYWPPMHECTQPFFLTEGNREVAARYGIYIGGSHCEPMACSAAAEWGIRGKGDYNYIDNKEAVKKFWQDRLDEVKDQEILYTIGMRGVHDGAMQGAKTAEEKLNALQQVIYDQREMFEKTKPGMADGKQLFVPYKEVLDIYKAGLKVPEDVTLMWTDDNYGYIRHFPDSEERARKGGNGIYYHVSYWGAPQDYLWLGSFSPHILYQQMKLAYEKGIQQVWVLNVGDIKPAEFLIEQWMELAWSGFKGTENEVMDMMTAFYAREFGKKAGTRIANMMNEWHGLALERRPEFMGNTRVYENNRSWWAQHRAIPDWTTEDVKARVAAYKRISDEAEKITNMIADDRQSAYFQMVKYQVQGAAQMNFKFLCPEIKDEAYDSIAVLTKTYNDVLDGKRKWDGMMDMAPRKLPVFDRVNTLLSYPEPTEKFISILEKGKKVSDNAFSYSFPKDAIHNDSITIVLEALPAFPVDGDRLAVKVSTGTGHDKNVEFQTKYHAEEWKMNVLRNKAIKRISMPANSNKLTISILDEGVVLTGLKIKM